MSGLTRQFSTIFASLWFVFGVCESIACPLCETLSGTFSDDLAECSHALLGECNSIRSLDDFGLVELQFDRIRALKQPSIDAGKQPTIPMNISIVCNQGVAKGNAGLLLAYDAEKPEFGPPMILTPQAAAYLVDLVKMKEKDKSRLKFCLAHLASIDRLVSDDCYNELARAPIEMIRKVIGSIDRTRIVDCLRSEETPTRHKCLYWMLLAECGKLADGALFEEIVRPILLKIEGTKTSYSDIPIELTGQIEPPIPIWLAPAFAAYMSLVGEEAIADIERSIIDNERQSVSVKYAALSAIRVVGTDLGHVEKPRLAKSLTRFLVDKEMADFVVPDLARWEHWECLPQLIELFEAADPTESMVRVPIINFVRVCPTEEAKLVLPKLQAIDPKAAARARSRIRVIK